MTKERALLRAVREFLWVSLNWNDHNFEEGVVASKCRRACKELGITSIEDANEVLDDLATRLERLESE